VTSLWAGHRHYCVQTGSVVQRASYPMGTSGFFCGGKAVGTWSSLLTYINLV